MHAKNLSVHRVRCESNGDGIFDLSRNASGDVFSKLWSFYSFRVIITLLTWVETVTWPVPPGVRSSIFSWMFCVTPS